MELIRERTWPSTAAAVRLLLGPEKCPVGPLAEEKNKSEERKKERERKKEKEQLCFLVPFDAC